MTGTQPRYAQILSTGRYVPERMMSNAEFEPLLGKPVDQWLIEKVGIRERHVMAPDEVTSDLVVAAGKQAMERAGVSPQELDLIIVATDTPDYISPATASVVQAKLNAVNAGTYDVNCACAAWVTALDCAARYVETDPDLHTVLVAGGYGMTKFLDWHDLYTATLFADGAGAVVLGAGDRPGHRGGKLTAAGQYHDALGVYTGGTFRPATAENIAAYGPPTVRFVKKFPATFNSENWPPLIHDVLRKAGWSVDDVDLYLFTQLNLRTIEAMMQILGQPMTKTHTIMEKWGYTGSACIPMALDDAVEQGLVRPGMKIVFCASGGGLAMACSAWEWTANL
ncbi:MAG TPA: ketoacyl-ACP synthase III [Anaerolineae bacterium]